MVFGRPHRVEAARFRHVGDAQVGSHRGDVVLTRTQTLKEH
jgi:hypothetical protein